MTINNGEYVFFVGCGSSVVGAPIQSLGTFVLPHIACVFRMRRYITCWSLQYGVYARSRGSKIISHGGKCVTFRRLHMLA